MGDAANLATQLKEMTKDLGFPILHSIETFPKILISWMMLISEENKKGNHLCYFCMIYQIMQG
jgi:hypothetical protein